MFSDDSRDHGDFWDLWVSHKEVLFRKCLKIMQGNIDEAEDALSAAMLKARDKMAQPGAGIQNFRGWALRLTENVCIDLLRRRRRLVSYGDIPEYMGNGEVDDGYSRMEFRETLRFQEVALREVFGTAKGLPLRLREPCWRRFFLSQSYPDIAAHLGISEQTARKRIQEVRAVLKQRHGSRIAGLLTCSLPERAGDSEASLAAALRRDIHAALSERGEPEMAMCCSTAWLVRAWPDAGQETEALVFLPLKAGCLEKKLVSLLRYVARHPTGWKKVLELAQIFCAAGSWDKAERGFRHVLRRQPRSFVAWVLLGRMLRQAGRKQEAESLFGQAGTVARCSSSRSYFGGMAALCRQRHAEALTAFQRASDLEPANICFRHAVGSCLFDAGRRAEALDAFRGILAQWPADLVSLAWCCEIALSGKRFQEAGEYLDRILQQNPHDYFALKRSESLARETGLVRPHGAERLCCLVARLERVSRLIGTAACCLPDAGA